MALERLTRISGPGISSELSLTFSGGVTVNNGIITATTLTGEVNSVSFDTNESGVVVTGVATATSFVKSSGTSSQFLKADGSVDTNTYLTSYTETDTLNSITGRGNSTANGISVGVLTATSLIKSGGTSSQFLKADGSVDTNTYLTSETFTAIGIQSGGVSIGNATALNFVGTGNTFAVNGNTIDVSISGGGGGGSSLTVKEVASQGGATNVTVSNISEIQFNNGSGFNVSDQGSGTAFVDISAIGGLSSQEVTTGTTNVISAIMGSEPRQQDWLTYWPNGAVPPNSSTSYFPAYSASGIATTNLEFSFRIGIGYQSLYNPADSYIYLNRKPHYRRIIQSQGASIGIAEAFANYNRNSSYNNVTTMIMPIRNTSGSDINVTVYYALHCSGGTYMGASVFTMTPGNSSGTTYSTVNSVTYGQVYATTLSLLSNGSPQTGNTTVTIPAGKTVLVAITESSWQITAQTANRFSAFYRLNDTFANANIQCDLRMVETMANADFYNLGWTNRSWPSGQEYRLWNACGTLYGDR